jgi:UDP-N-acetylmuramate--alanine ligase
MTYTSLVMTPERLDVIHFIGIGGIGLSGMAEILHARGFKVQGSDLYENANSQRLIAKGIHVFIGHHADHIKQATVIVKSTAVKDDNPELIAGRKAGIPIVKRADMLAEMMRHQPIIAISGTHGKTTTTSLVAAMLESAGLSPTVLNGGIINQRGTNAYLGQGQYIVVEADESDGTFTRLPACIVVVTNIDPEHLDHYGNFENLKLAFHQFVNQIPYYGFAVLCIDHPEVRHLAQQTIDRTIRTYSITDSSADMYAEEIEFISHEKGYRFCLHLSHNMPGGARIIRDIILPTVGKHNVQNALAALTIGCQLGADDRTLAKAFLNFEGVKRRFTKVGQCCSDVTIIDDYGHHPEEIRATLLSARDIQGKEKEIIAIIQPHRYSRLQDLWHQFARCASLADHVLITEVYPAGEAPKAGINAAALCQAMREEGGHNSVHLAPTQEQLAPVLYPLLKPKTMILCLGAGSISQWAYQLPQQLSQLAHKYTQPIEA